MGNVTIEWDGMDRLIRGLASVGADAAKIAVQSLNAEAQLVFRDSQRQVPYKTGALRASGRIEPATANGSTISVEITYGGTATQYAAYVHEIPKNYNHGKKAHYLSDPVEAAAPRMGDRISKRITDTIDRKLG
jgi:hypothetical protein